MGDASEKKCFIIGPTESGKTSLLGILQFATAQQADQPKRALRILPASPDMAELIELSTEVIDNVTFAGLPGTQEIKRYAFDYEVTDNPRDGLFRRERRTRFSMIDMPGAAVLGSEEDWAAAGLDTGVMREARKEAVEQLRSANYIMLCADSTDEARTSQFIRHLPRILMETGVKRLACEKLVVCLTKADKFVVEHPAITTREEFEHEDPVKRARRVISDAGLNTLKMYLREENIRIMAGWASVYGFEPETGRPNYSADDRRILIDAEMNATAADILERWQPYQVIDPFIYLTAGDPMGLKNVPPLGSGVSGLQPLKLPASINPIAERVRSWLGLVWRWIYALYRYVK